MIKNYFKTALRNFSKVKVFSFLNIFGLAVALGIAILLSIYALFELSPDQFRSERMYQVYSADYISKGPAVSTSKEIPIEGAIKEVVPGVLKTIRYTGNSDLIIYCRAHRKFQPHKIRNCQPCAKFKNQNKSHVISYGVIQKNKTNCDV